jgi:hypothetical protein
MRHVAMRMKVRRSVIALEYSDRPTGSQQSLHYDERRRGIDEMLENETDEHMVERLFVIGQVEQVGVEELNPVCGTKRLDSCPRVSQGRRRTIDGNEVRTWTAAPKSHGRRHCPIG